MVMRRGRGGSMPQARTRTRMKVLAALVVFMFAALTTRLWFLQVLASPEFSKEAQQNRVRLVPTMPVRGKILDRDGKVLVGERPTSVVLVNRQELGDRADEVMFRLSQVLHMPAKLLVRRMNNLQYLPYQPVPVAEDVPRDQVFYIAEHADLFPGVSSETQSLRSYPQGDIAAQVLGHIGPITAEEVKTDPDLGKLPPTTEVGQAGIEQEYDAYLRGVPGKKVIQVNAQGRVLNANDIGSIPATNGDNVVLSIDGKVQALAEQSLAEGIAVAHNTYDTESGKYLQATGGAAIVMDPRTGRILAMASNPTYDPSLWIGGLSQKQYKQIRGTGSVPGALFNRAIQGAYPPGSTFKTFVGAAALRQHYITERTALSCPGEYEVPGDTSHTVFHNWNPVNTGYLTLTSALVQSCDTFFYQLGYKFWQAYVHSGYEPNTGAGGKEFMQTDLSRMGFGKTTGVDLPLEAKGILGTNAYKKALEKEAPAVYGKLPWLPGDYLNMAIGQGFMTTTPMELATAYAAIANGGKIVRAEAGVEDRRARRHGGAGRPPHGAGTPADLEAGGHVPPERAERRDPSRRDGGARLRRLPALVDSRGRQDRHRRHRRQAAVLVVRGHGAGQQPEVRRGRHGRAGWSRRDDGRAGGATDPPGPVQPQHGVGRGRARLVDMSARGRVD